MENTDKKPLVEAAFGRVPARMPVWFLRQAGRYLPEYMKVREKLSFVELCSTPELASEVTLQPLRRFDLDAAIIFSDILVPPMAMGQDLTFDKGHGPRLSNPVRSAAGLKALKTKGIVKDVGWLGEAISRTAAALEKHQTMIGFAGAPFTVATYMIEGEGSKTYTEVKKLRYSEPETFRGLMDVLAEVTIDYLLMQVEAGAQALMLFDTWANQISVPDYREFVAPALGSIFRAVKEKHPEIPLIYYAGQGTDLYPELGGYAMDVLAVDWRVSMATARERMEANSLSFSVQGNLDPHCLAAPEATIRENVRRVIAQGKGARGHIFNVGHGLLPHLSPDAVGIAVDEIRKQDEGK